MPLSNKEALKGAYQFIRGGSSLSKPGFAHSIRTGFHTFDPSRLSWDGDTDTLTYLQTFENECHPPTTALLFALLDEWTTVACFTKGQPSAPGLSLAMKLTTTVDNMEPYSELKIRSTVLKLGRTISNSRCEFYGDDKLVAHGSHVKYMPTGNLIKDIVFTQKWAWSLYNAFAFSTPPPQYPKHDLWVEVMGENLHYGAPGEATFVITAEHVNPFGGLHGGCHGLLMELVGKNLLMDGRVNVPASSFHLESLSIDYVSVGKDLVRVIARKVDERQMVVEISSVKTKRLVSQGHLQWSITSKQTSNL